MNESLTEKDREELAAHLDWKYFGGPEPVEDSVPVMDPEAYDEKIVAGFKVIAEVQARMDDLDERATRAMEAIALRSLAVSPFVVSMILSVAAAATTILALGAL